MTTRILIGDALAMLRTIPSESVQMVCTSPPYFGLRSYGTDPQIWGGASGHDHEWDTVPSPGSRSSDTNPGPLQHPGNKNRERLTSDLCPCGAWRGELGLEPTPALFIEHLVAIFREVKRVLRRDGLCFVNLSDSYSNDAKWGGSSGGKHVSALHGQTGIGRQKRATGVPAKSLFLIPQRFAIAMQDDGWIVRQEIVWAKKACMPESVKDRFTRSWEPIWMFAKSGRYFFDQDAVRQPAMLTGGGTIATPDKAARAGITSNGTGLTTLRSKDIVGANMRDVFLLGPQPSSLNHYAGYPPELPKRCILAGSRKGDTVLDPFLGSGTTLLVASRFGRDGIGVELNPEYAHMAEDRIHRDAGDLFPEDIQVTETRQPTLFDQQEAV